MTKTFYNKKRSALRLFTALLTASPFVLNVAAKAAPELPSNWEDGMRLGVRAYEKGENRAAFDTFSKLMIEGGRRLGPSDGRMARLYTNMGEVYAQEQEYKYAEDCLKKGLNVAQTGYGKNSVQIVPPLIDLAQLYVRQGKDGLAQPLLERALAIVSKPGDDTLLPYAMVVEADLGSMFYAEGRYAVGEPHFKRALEFATKSLGPSHKWTTTIGAMYASCLHAQGKGKEAKAIEQAARAKANETESVIAVWNRQIGLADEAIAAKRAPDAEAALKLATQAAQELSAEPMLQVLTLIRYGQFFLMQDKPALAIEKWKAAQVLADATLGLEDKSVLDHAKQLADLEKAQNQYRDAEPLYTRLVANAKNKFGSESDEYAKSLGDIADLYTCWAQYPQAAASYSKLLALQEKKFGTDSEKLIPSLVALATVAQNNTHYLAEVNAKAEDHLKRASDIATKHFGKNSKELAPVLDALSHYYQRHFDWEKAAKTCTQLIAADEKNFGPNSAETTKALERYAIVLRAAGLRNEAEPIEARIAKIKGTKADPEN